MPNTEPKVRTRTRTRRDGVAVTKTITKGKLADGGKYREKVVQRGVGIKTKGKVVYGESTKKALGVTDKGKAKVKYKNKLSTGMGSYGEGSQYEFSGVKTKRMSPGVKKTVKTKDAYMENVPSETYVLRGGKTVTTPAYTDVLATKYEKTKKSKGRGVKRSYEYFETGGYNEYGKKMKDKVIKRKKSR